MDIVSILERDDEPLGVVGSPSSSFEAIVDIKEVSETSKLLGELVCFQVSESDNQVLVLGQITEIETKNRWHEEPSFKGIIKRHGKLPNLSGIADNRIAKITVQSSFVLAGDHSQAHKLANSPSSWSVSATPTTRTSGCRSGSSTSAVRAKAAAGTRITSGCSAEPDPAKPRRPPTWSWDTPETGNA